MTEQPKEQKRAAPECPGCGTPMRFEKGMQTHDRYAEHFVCPKCAREEYRSYGRGSV